MIYLLPFIAAFIGWFTNWLAIKMLFHPKEPKNILGFTIQGIFPKRQKQFAEKLGALVAKELISYDDIAQKLESPHVLQKSMPIIEAHVNKFIDSKLQEEIPLLSMFISGDTLNGIKKAIIKEMELLFPTLLKNMSAGMKQELDIEKLVVDKVTGFSSDKLENILNSIMKKEFRFVEILGAVLGFLVGLLQIALARL